MKNKTDKVKILKEFMTGKNSIPSPVMYVVINEGDEHINIPKGAKVFRNIDISKM